MQEAIKWIINRIKHPPFALILLGCWYAMLNSGLGSFGFILSIIFLFASIVPSFNFVSKTLKDKEARQIIYILFGIGYFSLLIFSFYTRYNEIQRESNPPIGKKEFEQMADKIQITDERKREKVKGGLKINILCPNENIFDSYVVLKNESEFDLNNIQVLCKLNDLNYYGFIFKNCQSQITAENLSLKAGGEQHVDFCIKQIVHPIPNYKFNGNADFVIKVIYLISGESPVKDERQMRFVSLNKISPGDSCAVLHTYEWIADPNLISRFLIWRDNVHR